MLPNDFKQRAIAGVEKVKFGGNGSPMVVLREMKIEDARAVVEKTMELIKACPDELYDLLVRHTYDANVYESIFPSESW